MSTLVISGAQHPGTMLDYQRQHPPSTTLPYRPQPSSFHSEAYPQQHRQSYSPNPSSHRRSPSQEISSHKHTRSASSSALPFSSTTSASSGYSQNHVTPASTKIDPRRSSIGTYPSPANTMSMQRQGTTASTASAPRRSTSSRSSTNSPTSYVALMRKQKATVWCDRSQNIDPRIAAAHRAAKQRAALEVHGGNNTSAVRTSTINSGGVVGKIRHGGVPKAPGYVPANLSGAGVPMRLSANEMLGDDEEGRSLGDNSMAHGRSGSGRSSTNSAKYRSGYPRADTGGRFSANNTPPSGVDGGSPQERLIPEDGETQQGTITKNEYFDGKGGNGEDEDSFGGMGDLAAPSAVKRAEQQAKTADDLRRRGSVDERAMSINAGVRLFVANPDLDP